MRPLKWIGIGFGACVFAAGIFVAVGVYTTEGDIEGFRTEVRLLAAGNPAPTTDPAVPATVPEPVQRYFDFTFPDGMPPVSYVVLEAEGMFRRPLTESFEVTTAEQTIAVGTPALMFSATTPILPGLWARAYDYYARGEMEMKAKLLSAVTVVDEQGSDVLNTISLRRWLLESALFPQALLPGGPVVWEPIDGSSARAVVEADGLRASMVAHFAEDGRMTHMTAEEDGDLTTPYHGSGEHVSRDDYRNVSGVMIPHRFVISRMRGDDLFPFFDAAVTDIAFF